MTIAIHMKVNDGMVLATDSASTIMAQDQSGNIGVVNIYNNANKLFNIHKQLPIGLITWGAGSIGGASTSTLIKDFRDILTCDPTKKIDINNYSIKNICDMFVDFIYKEKYIEEFKTWPQKPDVGFVIAGYSTNQEMAEEWLIEINNGVCAGPVLRRAKEETGMSWYGQPEAITRLYKGYGTLLPNVFVNSGIVPSDKIEDLMKLVSANCELPLTHPAMPIQDAIELAEFLVDLTEKYSKYAPGPQTVGGPIEIACITKHEGFKWIKRKHYFDDSINR
ncbi:hypothetical protein [Clostridium sp.]|uniref:hypothetical protein n=1 Tax=Clostridium sp. TaxID=1506 RepID=UPI001A3898A4|nr:hypothetical protein [Clostridium sp.]MBK5243054.1 hypothetical protein [Clostridium sp.]